MSRNPIITERFPLLPTSAIAGVVSAMGRLRSEGKPVIDLAMGKPTHPTSQAAKAAMIGRIESGNIPYGAPAGDVALRQEIANNLNVLYRLKERDYYSAGNVVITEGSATATYIAQGLAIEAGKKALFVTPAYTSYAPAVKLWGGDFALAPSSKEDGFQPDISQLAARFEENEYEENGVLKNRIATVMLNYPNNPTGATLSESKTLELANFFSAMSEKYQASGFLVLLDESYLGISTTPHQSILQHPISETLRKNIIILGSASKISAMPGARCGYAVAHPEYAALITKGMGAVMLSANTIAQEGALADFREMTPEQRHEIQTYYDEKVNFVGERLNHIGGSFGSVPVPVIPNGGMFVFADMSMMLGKKIPQQLQAALGESVIENDLDIANYFLHSAGVAVVPGSGFFRDPSEGFVRLCVSGSFNKSMAQDEDLVLAMDKIERSVRELFSTKKIAVIGSGNVGTFLSAAILNGSENCDLTIVENNERRRAEIMQHGVVYEAGTGGAKISATIPSERLRVANLMSEPADAVFIATKSYQLTPQFYHEQIAPFLHENSKVVLVQNGYPDPEILAAVGNKAVVMVVNAGFSLDEGATKTVTNKSQIDLPYGSPLNAISREELEATIGQLFLGNTSQISARCDENIFEDVMKKAQYACIGAYCAVEAFKSRHPHDQKFTFGNLSSATNSNGEVGGNALKIAHEIRMIAGSELLSDAEIQSRIATNSTIENSLVTDARSGRNMERGIVDNLRGLAKGRGIETAALDKLSRALEVIEQDRWALAEENIQKVEKIISPDLPSNSTQALAYTELSASSQAAGAEIN